MKLTPYYLCLFFALSACATSGNPDVANQAVISKIEKGKTTQEQVRQLLGEPQVKTNLKDDTEQWEYAYVDMKLKGATFIPIVGLFAGGGNADVKGATFTFDKNRVVSSYTTSDGKIETRNFGKTKTNVQKTEH
jgi:outer membrane protein assembly factor BamE (lipoprotein component of BamABCDE complex)